MQNLKILNYYRFRQKKIFLMLYKCSSEQAEINVYPKEMNICEDSANLHKICTI